MATFTDKLSDFFRGPGGTIANLTPIGSIANIGFDLLGGNRAQDRRFVEESGALTADEERLRSMLAEERNINRSGEVRQAGEEALGVARRESLRGRNVAQEQLLNRLADAGVLDSGVTSREFANLASQGNAELGRFAGELEREAQQTSLQERDRDLVAQQALAQISGVQQQREKEAEAVISGQKQQAIQSLSDQIGLATSIIALGSGNPAAAAGAAKALSNEELLRLLGMLDELDSFQPSSGTFEGDPGPGLTPAEPFFT